MGHARHIAGITTLAIAMGLPQPTIAQTNGNAVVQAALPTSGSLVCLARQIDQSDGPSFTFIVLAPADQETATKSAGYAAVACKGRELKLADYKAKVCKMYTEGNEAVQNRWTHVLGVSPQSLCAAAKRLLPETADAALINEDLDGPKLAERANAVRIDQTTGAVFGSDAK